MSKLINSSMRYKKISLIAGQVYNLADFDSTHPQIIQIKNNNLVDVVYISDNSNVSTTTLQNLVQGSIRVFTFPKGVNNLYFYCLSNCVIDVTTFEATDITASDLDNTQISVISNSTTTSSVLVTGLPALPSGVNTIGNVGINGTIPVSMGGGVAVTSLPAMPSGANVIGHVIVDSVPVVHNIIDTLPSTPAGGNKIGKVDIDLTTTFIPQASTVIPTIYNVIMTTLNTEYSQALPSGTKKILVSVQGGDSTFIYRYAYVTGKVATPTSPFKQYNGDIEVVIDGIALTGVTLYFASNVSGKTIQIESWT